MKAYAAIFLAAALGVLVLHRGMDRLDIPRPATLKETLPSEEAVKLLSLGYKSLAADYYWLRALNEFGDSAHTRAKYPNLEALMRRVLALDPYFVAAYRFAGTALTVQELDPKVAIELLSRGMEFRPDAWQVPFLLGFNLFYFAHDYAAAATALAKAAMLPGAPEISGPLATRLAAEAGRPEIGLALVDLMLETTTDDKLRAMYEERRDLLELEVEMEELDKIVKQYNEIEGHAPKRLDDLRRAGLINAIPQDPLGGSFYVDDHGNAATTSESKRLRVSSQVFGVHP